MSHDYHEEVEVEASQAAIKQALQRDASGTVVACSHNSRVCDTTRPRNVLGPKKSLIFTCGSRLAWF
jgi:hypothetical protein